MNFDLAEINYAFARNYAWYSNPAKINEGDCYVWAYVAYKLIEKSELCSVWANGHHAFVKVGNKYYDSESLSGEYDWRDLKFFKRHPWPHSAKFQPQLQIQTEKEYFEMWNYLDDKWKLIYDSVLEWI